MDKKPKLEVTEDIISQGKHILLITPGFPKNEDDENCIPPLQDYARILAGDNERKVSVITLQYPAEKGCYDWFGIKVHSCGGNDTRFPKRLIIWNDAVRAFKTIYCNLSVDVIHSFWLSECTLIGNYLSSKFRIKHFTTFMGKEISAPNHYLRFLKLKKLKIICLSNRQADLLKRIGYSELVIIPWGLIPDFIPTFKVEERKFDVIGVGSLIDIKNFSSFINIIRIVKIFLPDIKCLIIGGGPLNNFLQSEIEESALDQNITLTGELKRHQVFEYMNKSKILLHTSSFESFGMVFIEALYYGLHIVSKPIGIAWESDTWSTCKSDHEMANEIIRILSFKVNYNSSIPYTMHKTVKSYLNIFFPPD